MNYTSVKLVREGEKPEEVIKGAEDAVKFVSDLYDSAVEKTTVIALDSRNRINAIEVVSVGTVDASLAHPREIFQVPILTASKSIILAHNHPSGDTTPSKADKKVTKRVMEAGKILGIKVLDHIILGKPGEFTSMQECMVM